jgi:ATP-dependent RNA helicase RhlB
VVERKPHPHAAATASAATGVPPHAPKPGFFRRIMRMFSPR